MEAWFITGAWRGFRPHLGRSRAGTWQGEPKHPQDRRADRVGLRRAPRATFGFVQALNPREDGLRSDRLVPAWNRITGPRLGAITVGAVATGALAIGGARQSLPPPYRPGARFGRPPYLCYLAGSLM